jgi:hypothetical protein
VYLAAAPAVPLAPSVGAAASITALLLLLAVAFLMTLAAMKLYEYTIGAGLRKLADVLNVIPFVDIGDRFFAAMDNAIMGGFAEALDAQEWAAMKLFAGLSWIAETMFDVMADLAGATWQAINGIVHGEIPTQLTQRTEHLLRRLRALDKAVTTEVARLSHAIARRTQALEAELDRTFGLARRGIDAIQGVTIPRIRREIADVRASIGALRRHVYGRLDRRLSRVEKLVIGGALTAAVLGVLTRYFPWWRCTNVRRFNRALCRMPVGGLDNLLGLVLAFSTTFGILEFAELMQEVTEPFAEAVRDVLDDTRSAEGRATR